MFGSGSVGGDVTPSHSGADLRRSSDAGTGRWLSPTRFIVTVAIILIIGIWLIPKLLRAREPSYEAQCMAKLKQVSWAVSMYVTDNDVYPFTYNWHWAIRTYIDDKANPFMRVAPGSARDPLKCPMDRSDAPCSYLYLDRRVLDYTMSRLNDAVTPLAVDEYFHEKATMVFYDGHAEKMPRDEWAYKRLSQWKVRRDLDDPGSFSYELIPGTQKRPNFAPPQVEETEKYIWPSF